MSVNAPEFDLLSGPSKRLVRKLGMTEEHLIVADSGEAGTGWLTLEDLGWVRITDSNIQGYAIGFTLSGWERWCRQCDAEDGEPLQPLEFE